MMFGMPDCIERLPVVRSGSRVAIVSLGGLAVVAALSGCAASESAEGSTPGVESTETSGGPYADGTYEATGAYQSPAGAESIDVELTLADDVVTDVEVTGNATNGNAKRYQSQFAEGIADVVVGVNIDELSVDKVAGSSLTSDGFNDALDQIKADALA